MGRPLCIVRELERLACVRMPADARTPFIREPLTERSAAELSWPSPLAAWHALASAPGATASTLVDVLHVILTTIPERDSSRSRAELPRLERPTPAPKRTAAHPRGFRGTINQPPKSSQPAA